MTIVISKGPEIPKVTVPPLVNMSIEQVRAQLEGMGLKGKETEQFSDEYPEGRVIWQNIEAGTQVEKNTVIELWVSKGPEPAPSEPEPSDELPVSEPPEESGIIAAPTEVINPVSTRNVEVDLSAYEGTVNVRIVVGELEVHNGAVDANQDIIFSKPVTAAWPQMVYIYINGSPVSSYSMQP